MLAHPCWHLAECLRSSSFVGYWWEALWLFWTVWSRLLRSLIEEKLIEDEPLTMCRQFELSGTFGQLWLYRDFDFVRATFSKQYIEQNNTYNTRIALSIMNPIFRHRRCISFTPSNPSPVLVHPRRNQELSCTCVRSISILWNSV